MATPVLIDCDPGIDDTLALIYLAGLQAAGEIEIVGVTTPAGNVGVHDTAANAAWVLSQCGLNDEHMAARIAPGTAAPLEVELTITPETHGPIGLGHVTGVREALVDTRAWREIWDEAIAEYGAQLRLIVTGPATNLALYLRDHPELGGQAGPAVTVMGGAVNYRGNTTPTAEWNFWVDPHAAAKIFAHPAATARPITLCSLEVTEQLLLTPQRLDQLVEVLAGVPIAQYLPEILRFYFEFHDGNGEGYQAQIHDLLTCMIALGRIPFEATATTIAVEADSRLMRGTSVADLRGHWGKPANAQLVTSADIPAAWAECERAARALADFSISSGGDNRLA